MDDSTKAREQGLVGERLLLCSLEIGSGKGRRIDEEKRRADEDTRSPTWQLTPEIEDDWIAESVKIAR